MSAFKKYYYFIASLPDLALDDYKDPTRLVDFIAELDEILDDTHKSYVGDILAIRDNINLLDILTGSGYGAYFLRGRFSKEDLRLMIAYGETVWPAYTKEFIRAFKDSAKEGSMMNRQQAQDLSAYFYYRRMLHHENSFFRAYFSFDLNLRNALIALNARKFDLKSRPFVEADGDLVTLKLKSSPFADFGLSGDLEYMERLVEVFEQGDLVATEKHIDMLRWEKIDEINTFSYFDIEVILGFLLKLMMCERWIHLEPKKGHEAFERLIQAQH